MAAELITVKVDGQPVSVPKGSSALEAINGFILLGWSTAYLVAASTRHGPFRLGEHF